MAKEKILDVIKSSKTIDSVYDIKLNKGQGTNAASATRKDYVDSAIATGDALKVSKTGDTMTGNLTVPVVNLSGNQTSAPNTVTRKDYVDAEILKQVAKAGDTMTGNLTVPTVLLSNSQSNLVNSSTRKDYVDSQDALKLNKAGDTMTGNLTVNANINASNIFSTGSITANTTSTYSGLRLSSNSSGYSEIVPRRANEADYLWSNGIRYYDSNNYWAIGSNRILHDAYSPRLTSIASPSDLNTISVPVKTMSLAHFWSSATNKPNTSDSANSVVHISTYETGTYAHQLAFSSDGKIYNRYNNNVSWSDWGQVYTSIYKPTPADVGAVNKTGDTMTGNLSTPKVLLTTAQGAEANSVTRRDFVEATVTAAGSGKKDLTIALPSGAPATGYIPVSFNFGSANNSEIYINTRTDVGAAPMNNCSFNGIVRASGWGDASTYSTGFFTIHDLAERSLHSFQSCTENATNFFVAYVETRAFPINVRVDVGVTVTASATDVTFGTSVFKVNGQDGGNTKTMVIANFDKGLGYYNRGNRVYDTGYNPTPDDVGAVDKAGDSMSGQLTLTPGFVDTSVNAQLAHIGKDATKALYIRNMREHNSSAWVWEKLYNGSLYYSSGVNGAGTNKIRLLVSGTGSGEIYLGANADKRVYHEGFKPTAGDVGAVNKTGDTMTGNLTASKVLVSGAQGAEGNALTRKDYIDTELSRKLSLTGGKVTGPITSLATDNFRIASGSIGTFWRKDDTQLYLMLTAPGDPEGGYNNLRPFHVGLTDGSVFIDTKLLLPAGQAQQADAATRKDYVDGQVATRAPTTHTHTVSAITDLNAQNATATANTLNN